MDDAVTDGVTDELEVLAGMGESADVDVLDVGDWGLAGGACASRFWPNAIAKTLPPIMGARETKPQFSEKCAAGCERVSVTVSQIEIRRSTKRQREGMFQTKENHVRSPNHSMVIVGNSPKRLPYAMPKTALAIHRLSGSSVVYSVIWDVTKSAATIIMQEERGRRRYVLVKSATRPVTDI